MFEYYTFQIECCGPSAWQDYEAFNKVVPNECRNTANGNLQTDGCAEIFARWMEPKTGWLSGIALLLVVIQVIQFKMNNTYYIDVS